jgi:signal transduction histidine kinase
VAGQLERLEELAASAMHEIQVLVSQLRPTSVAEEGLPAALRRLAAEWQAREGLDVTVEVSGERAREMGWRLSVDSSPGQGTRIRAVENPPGGEE